jgi:hypothetical protein
MKVVDVVTQAAITGTMIVHCYALSPVDETLFSEE